MVTTSSSWTEPRVPWKAPAPYGYPFAIEGMGGVAAPLLAGFSLTMIGLSINSPGALRWPSYTLAFLATAFILLIFTVQFTFWAKMYWVTPSQAKEWWPDFEDDLERRRLVYDEQAKYAESHSSWSTRARLSYNLAICSLLLGLVTVLFPQAHHHVAVARWVAVGVALFGLLAEVLWILWTPLAKFAKRPAHEAKPRGRGVSHHITKRPGVSK